MIGVIGSCCVDECLYVDFIPSSSQDARILKRELKLGGCATYVARAIQDCVLISTLGKGIYGEYVKNEILKENFDCILIPATQENGVCICMIEQDGERTFLSDQGVEYIYQKEIIDELEEFDWIYLSGIDLEIKENEWILNDLKGKNIFFSPGPRFQKISCLDKILSLHPVLHMNRQECESWSQLPLEKGIEKIYEQAQNIVFVTDGENGSYAYDGKLTFVASTPIQVKNSVGAGDSHAGICLKGMAENKCLKEILGQANTYASKVLSEK